MDEATEQEIAALLQSGKKLAAVKRYREATGASLSASKEAVERMAQRQGQPVASRIGCLGVVVAVVVALQAIAVSLV
ncbi:hypothetical protein [Roseimaritima sediminicola]|uniref:hypothetical protein n=1 Tax=Roseimaritima sediminicola TaxID=2662066 RepID=UPI00129828E6|nr:hypothetical protein [Roseimaritima sediminicola]